MQKLETRLARVDKMIDEGTGREYDQLTIEYYQPTAIKEAEGVNGAVISYYMPLEEIEKKYGKAGDTNGYESPILFGNRVESHKR